MVQRPPCVFGEFLVEPLAELGRGNDPGQNVLRLLLDVEVGLGGPEGPRGIAEVALVGGLAEGRSSLATLYSMLEGKSDSVKGRGALNAEGTAAIHSAASFLSATR